MSYGVLKPFFEMIKPRSWAVRQFKGNASLVLDTHPGEDERTSVMIIGHADKIRMQVRSIGNDGKIWINSDSFLPTCLIGHEVQVFSRDPKKPGTYRVIDAHVLQPLYETVVLHVHPYLPDLGHAVQVLRTHVQVMHPA